MVHRFTAAIVSIALLTFSGVSALLHVHAYRGHDHPEHQHGPAAHVHSAIGGLDAHRDGEETATAHLEPCDPGEHAVSAAFMCVTPHQDQADMSTLTAVVALVPPVMAVRALSAVDLRTHSPPGTTDAPLRAPPLVTPA